jgi:hypothetical protein
VFGSLVTVFFVVGGYRSAAAKSGKIDQLMSIVAETDQIQIPRYSPLNLRAQIFDGSWRRFSLIIRKICAEKSARYDALRE